jgi:hypothetical protein
MTARDPESRKRNQCAASPKHWAGLRWRAAGLHNIAAQHRHSVDGRNHTLQSNKWRCYGWHWSPWRGCGADADEFSIHNIIALAEVGAEHRISCNSCQGVNTIG